MTEYFSEMWAGPGHLRFFVQPLIACILGIRDGINDARTGRPPYILALVTEPGRRSERLAEALKRLAIPLVLGVVLSGVFQWVIRRTVHPGFAITYGIGFIALPYVVVRALSNRLARPLVRRPV